MRVRYEGPRSIVVFGTGGFAEVVKYILESESDLRVVAFAETADRIQRTEFAGVPVVPFEEVGMRCPPETHGMFIAVGYAGLNAVRRSYFEAAKAKGYRLLTYVCSRATCWDNVIIGENSFVFEDNTVQPFVRIGDNVVVWSGNHIGHHSVIEDHCFITSHVVVSGHCTVGASSFVGVNATISEGTRIGQRNLIGPSSLIQKDTADDEAYLAPRTPRFAKPSSRFF
ncbi:MAG: acetyltransferase [Rhodocyclaceae bacterium]|nr:acetyltransferase [Rhodocyclaceae bacterium]